MAAHSPNIEIRKKDIVLICEQVFFFIVFPPFVFFTVILHIQGKNYSPITKGSRLFFFRILPPPSDDFFPQFLDIWFFFFWKGGGGFGEESSTQLVVFFLLPYLKVAFRLNRFWGNSVVNWVKISFEACLLNQYAQLIKNKFFHLHQKKSILAVLSLSLSVYGI